MQARQSNPESAIGIIGGYGPIAGVDVFDKLLRHWSRKHSAVEDSQYPSVMLLSAGVADIGAQAELSPQFEEQLVKQVGHLANAGASIIGIACNTAHAYYDQLEAASEVPIVNLLDEVAHHASLIGGETLLLTSRTTRDHELFTPYFRRYGVDAHYATEPEQGDLDHIIELVMGAKDIAASYLMTDLLQRAHSSGFQTVVAGCTELPLAMYRAHTGSLIVVDSNQVLAEALCEGFVQSMVQRSKEGSNE